MRYRKSLFVVFLFFTSTSFSQTKKYVYYFNKDLAPTDQANSVFNGVGLYENNLFELRLYNTSSKKLISVEHFMDSSLQLNDGFFSSFYANATTELKGNYLKGKQNGLWQKWDSLTHIIDSSIYDNGEKIMQANFIYHPNGNLENSLIINFKSNLIEQNYYNDNGNKILTKNFKNIEDSRLLLASPPTMSYTS